MSDFRVNANVRVKQYLQHNNSLQDKKAIKAFFIILKTEDLAKARRTALVKGSKNINYLIDNLSQMYSCC